MRSIDKNKNIKTTTKKETFSFVQLWLNCESRGKIMVGQVCLLLRWSLICLTKLPLNNRQTCRTIIFPLLSQLGHNWTKESVFVLVVLMFLFLSIERILRSCKTTLTLFCSILIVVNCGLTCDQAVGLSFLFGRRPPTFSEKRSPDSRFCLVRIETTVFLKAFK